MSAIGSGKRSAPVSGDPFGQALLAHLDAGVPGHYIVERDDGWIDVLAASEYFGNITAWTPIEADALEFAGSRVLDVGAGAGRVALYLQDRGLDVTALDTSPGAVEVCRRRGVGSTFSGSVFDIAEQHVRPFDTFVMFGNNLGLLGSPGGAAALLGAMRRIARTGARILGTTIDPYETGNPDHLDYHESNRRAGRMPGQITVRIRYDRLATDWFSLLWTSLDELRALAAPLGWSMIESWSDGPTRSVVLASV